MRSFFAFAFLTLAVAFGQAATAKTPLDYKAYDHWKLIATPRLSQDGTWVAYAVNPEEGDGELIVRNLRTGTEWRAARGADEEFSADSRTLVYFITPLKADVDAAKKAKKKAEDQPKRGFGILDLTTGKSFTFERVKSFKLPKIGSNVVAFLHEAALSTPRPSATPAPNPSPTPVAIPSAATTTAPSPAPSASDDLKKKDDGAELAIHTLGDAPRDVSVKDVSDYAVSADGKFVAYGTQTKDGLGDALSVRTVADDSIAVILRGPGRYRRITFAPERTQLAFVSDTATFAQAAPRFALYDWSPPAAAARALAATGAGALGEREAASDTAPLRFTRDGERLFFGVASAPTPMPSNTAEPIKVDLWHYRDVDLQPQQKIELKAAKTRNTAAVAFLHSGRVVRLGSKTLPAIAYNENARVALATSDLPYRRAASWRLGYYDGWRVDLASGVARKAISGVRDEPTLSPSGAYFLGYDEKARRWFTVRTADGKRVDLRTTTPVANELWDLPIEPQPYGVGGWTPGDRSVLLYDRYDIWAFDPASGAGRMLTSGAGRRTSMIFRIPEGTPPDDPIDPKAAPLVDDTKPIILSAVSDVTKASGFYRLDDARATPRLTRLMMRDAAMLAYVKAKAADTVVYRPMRFDSYPDLYADDTSFRAPRRITTLDSQRDPYLWGHSELMAFKNHRGVPLRAILTKPEGFDPHKKYPVLIYIYERLTDELNRFYNPAPGTSPNLSRYASNGYVILRPDITYTIGHPGESALDAVLSALNALEQRGFVDTKRVGIAGHSWGAYEIVYMITRTDRFRAVEAGAAVADMVSAYGGIRWESGRVRSFQYMVSQSRIAETPWDKPGLYIENSAIFHMPAIHTPYLTIHNDADGAVPWYQGIEFFTAMRQLGKEAYFFEYDGEDHGLRQRENQKHWSVHLDEFFDHFLLGKAAPDWMQHGVPYLHRGERDLRPLYGTPVTPPSPAPSPSATP